MKTPWGEYDIIDQEKGYKAKKLVINRNHRLSLQAHKHRDEIWAIASGYGTVVIDANSRPCKAGDMFFVRRGVSHRIAASNIQRLIVIETQVGLCHEDDIVRFDDDYGR